MHNIKDLIIVDTYPNTEEKKILLKNYLLQLKKSGKDILLVSHYPIDSDIFKIVNYFIYDEENFLLPKEKCPILWFADAAETVHLYQHKHCYAIVKNMYQSILYAKNMGYENFIFTEYDTILADEDISKIDNIFSVIKENKTAFIFSYHNYELLMSTNFFAANINFFINNIPLVKSIDECYTTYPYSHTTESIEFIFSSIFTSMIDKIHVEKLSIYEYFLNSKINVHNIFETPNPFVYNIDNQNIPTIFMITKNATYKIFVNGNIVYEKKHAEHEWLKLPIVVDNESTRVVILKNDLIISDSILNKESLEKLKEYGTIRKI
jgi:hypothetical protein